MKRTVLQAKYEAQMRLDKKANHIELKATRLFNGR
jgi:hypothetical protein